MARGNQRDKAREKTQKEQAAQVSLILTSARSCYGPLHTERELWELG